MSPLAIRSSDPVPLRITSPSGRQVAPPDRSLRVNLNVPLIAIIYSLAAPPNKPVFSQLGLCIKESQRDNRDTLIGKACMSRRTFLLLAVLPLESHTHIATLW